ncbi:28S ribosomal protein S14, mitochondrial [Halotydeus destructor]|nr:28S ribosomal protein S14, mitochondrial [Halotydeus destructor]
MASFLKQVASSAVNALHKNPIYPIFGRYTNRVCSRSERRGNKPTFPPRPHPKVELENCTVPLLPVAFTGSTYDTAIQRKNPIADPNKPFIWEYNCEGLKWTDWRMHRDVRRRYVVSEYCAVKQNLVCLYRSRLLPSEFRKEVHRDILQFPMWQSVSHVTNRCAITSRGRGKVRKWRLSRIIWRHLADYNYLSGVIKSRWGP